MVLFVSLSTESVFNSLLSHKNVFTVLRFFVLLIVYIIGGILINKYKFGLESMPEMCPNYHFWAGIPSLIKVKYAVQCSDARHRIKPKKPTSRDPSAPTLFSIKGRLQRRNFHI